MASCPFVSWEVKGHPASLGVTCGQHGSAVAVVWFLDLFFLLTYWWPQDYLSAGERTSSHFMDYIAVVGFLDKFFRSDNLIIIHTFKSHVLNT